MTRSTVVRLVIAIAFTAPTAFAGYHFALVPSHFAKSEAQHDSSRPLSPFIGLMLDDTLCGLLSRCYLH